MLRFRPGGSAPEPGTAPLVEEQTRMTVAPRPSTALEAMDEGDNQL